GVHRIVDVADLVDVFGVESFDLVVSTEMLENVDNWRIAVRQMAAVTRLGGILVITTRSEGFPHHDFPADYWRFSVDQMHRIVRAVGCEALELCADPEYPGVFVKARRTKSLPVGELEELEVGRAPQPVRR
ncbi:MAG: class I SAM-dependent methyltransferase, partial [Actinobacteria bacterium]|nr:class I SAM-dependent methyltransferase [Actinomycetota bacterium]